MATMAVILPLTAALGCSAPSRESIPPAVELPRIPQTGEFGPASHTYELVGPLVPKTTTMVTAWDLPQNPLTDPALDIRQDADHHGAGLSSAGAAPPRLRPTAARRHRATSSAAPWQVHPRRAHGGVRRQSHTIVW